MNPRVAKALCFLLTLRPDTAAAHAFQAGADHYEQFVEGTAVALTAPEIVLCLLPLGVLIGLWRRDGLPLVWPALVAGWLVGLMFAALLPDSIAIAALAIGAGIAALAALAPMRTGYVPQALAALCGAAAGAASFQGHGLFELPAATHAGLFFGANLAVAVTAGLIVASLDAWKSAWLRIAWRVVASWTAAIALMVLAFELRPYLG